MIRSISVIIIVAILTTWLIYRFPKAAISPGDLLENHRQMENNCLECHTMFLGVSGTKCQSCHESGKIGLTTVDGQPINEKSKRVEFHNSLGQETCTTCHGEHQGRTGSKSTTRFSHQILKPEDLKDCLTCHLKPTDSVHKTNSQTCAQCHTTSNWNPSNIDHRSYFRFDKHHLDDCESCHPSTNYVEYTCYNCHEHSPRKIEREHIKEGIQDYDDCVKCHRSGDEDEAERIWKAEKRHSNSSRGSKRDSNHQKSKRKNSKKERNKYKKHSDNDDNDHD